jgi:NAD(P)-dependent dehydrogenase (short-subunit alcohol dehydrogenase family)
MGSLDGKVAIVTGAASGIGRSIAYAMVREGAKVIIADVQEKGGHETQRMIEDRYPGSSVFIKADSSRLQDHEVLVKEAEQRFGALHIAVNNAGIAGPMAPTGEYPLEGWDHVIAVNLSGVFYAMRAQIPAMLRAGKGSIVNISSILGRVGFSQASAYTAAKHGVVGLTETAAIEYSSQGLRVNVVGPAFIRTPMISENLTEEALQGIVGLHPIGRLGEPEEVAELVVWLSSDKASFVTGSYYAVDGGYLAR